MYRTVGNRVAVDIRALQVPVSDNVLLDFLTQKGFRILDLDIVTEARRCIGLAAYVLRAKMCQAPKTLDCSGFVKYIFAQKGVWLPRLSIQQRSCGSVVSLSDMLPGDLLFSTGKYNWFDHNPLDTVGHVCIVSSKNTVVHASCLSLGVEEVPIDKYVQPNYFRGIRRIIPLGRLVVTLEIPHDMEIETSDDLRWYVLGEYGKGNLSFSESRMISSAV